MLWQDSTSTPVVQCCDKGQGSDPCVMKQELTLCNALTIDQKTQLATPSYKLKKDKKADKKESSTL